MPPEAHLAETNPLDPAAAIREVLGADGHPVESVEVQSVLTAGANRQTVKIGIHPGPVSAVAQIALRENDEQWIVPASDEAAILRTAAANGVPVPEVLAAGSSEAARADVLVTRFVSGETIPRRVLRSLAETANSEQSMATSCGQALAAIHGIDAGSVALTRPLDVFEPAGYLDHLRERLDDLPVPYPTFRFALNVLAEHLPEPTLKPALVHGDFRNGNLIVADGTVQSVLDWELVHLGDPMEDLAWLCLRTWRFGHDRLEVGGFTDLNRLRAAYEANGGRWRQDAFDWWTMARSVWWGIGLAAQAARFIDGTSSSIVHAASGRRVVELEYDLLNLLAPLIA